MIPVRPNDSRMWTALASIYETLEEYRDALNCYKRSLSFGAYTNSIDDYDETLTEEDVRGLLRIGKLHERMGEHDQAASCFEVLLKAVTVQDVDVVCCLNSIFL